jgi:hypothetical protein
VRVLLGNGCFCGSTVLAWRKYATLLSVLGVMAGINEQLEMRNFVEL